MVIPEAETGEEGLEVGLDLGTEAVAAAAPAVLAVAAVVAAVDLVVAAADLGEDAP